MCFLATIPLEGLLDFGGEQMALYCGKVRPRAEVGWLDGDSPPPASGPWRSSHDNPEQASNFHPSHQSHTLIFTSCSTVEATLAILLLTKCEYVSARPYLPYHPHPA